MQERIEEINKTIMKRQLKGLYIEKIHLLADGFFYIVVSFSKF